MSTPIKQPRTPIGMSFLDNKGFVAIFPGHWLTWVATRLGSTAYGTATVLAGTSSVVVTNFIVNADSSIVATCGSNDVTAQVKNVIAAVGSFTINLSSNATADSRINYIIMS